jgi:hypothetical protein
MDMKMNQVAIKSNFSPANLDEAMHLSGVLSQSSIVPSSYKGKSEDILVAIIMGSELGFSPIASLQNIATINGKPSIYGDAMLALVKNSPLCEDVIETMVKGEKQEDSGAVCTVKRKGMEPVVVTFTVGDAIRAGLWKKAGPWTMYPKRMLQMRARSFALRDAFPDVLRGLVATEEVEDYQEVQDIGKGKKKPGKPTPMSNPLDIMNIDEDGVIEMAETVPSSDSTAAA